MLTQALTIVFWVLALPTALVVSGVLLMTLAGGKLSAATPAWLAVATSLAVLALLVWAFRLATMQGRPGLATLITIGSWLTFGATMLINGLAHQKTWN